MKNFLYISVAAAALSLSSCSDYLDINQDPNSPTVDNLSSSMLMPGAEMQFAGTYGGDMRCALGYFSQHYAQEFGTSNYLDYSQFEMPSARNSLFYTYVNYKTLNNLQTILSKSRASEDWGSFLAATTLRAYIYQVFVDMWGEIPYSEAMDVSNISPKYDDGKDVYAGIVDELDYALSMAPASSTVCTNLLFPGETADAWIKFANALKLRILMRESGVVDVQDQLDALVLENNFPTEDVAYADCWADSKGSWNPFYDNEFSAGMQKNVIANVAYINTLNQEDDGFVDGRLAAYWQPNSNGDFAGGVSGVNFSTSSSFKESYWSRPVASPTDPVVLLSVASTEFFLAEYYAASGSTYNAEQHYNAAIQASFASAGAEGADEVIAKFPFDADNYAKCIGIQKWVDLGGYDTFEAWCELRRLGYPTFGTLSGLDIYNNQTDDSFKPELLEPATLYTPILVFGEVGANMLAQRFPYPESSTARNSNSPAFPGYKTPVFWAVK